VKQLHEPHLFGWSVFNPERNLDFHSVLWRRSEGNVAIDPLPLSAHDRAHAEALGGIREIVITNSDHVRASRELADVMGARVWVPRAEQALLQTQFGAVEVRGLGDGAEPFAGLSALELHGSKTPGELAVVIAGNTLVTGDLVRGHRAGRLNLLPDPKLTDKAQALASLRRLAALRGMDAVLVGDGWPVFSGGAQALANLLAELGG
jgi:hypothetical protein